jgi:Cof subfamily protein (haloacid dehalogenase superfamily)
MKYKAVVSDLDGTLLGPDHKVSEYTKNAIKKITDKGIKFFIATGRHHEDVIEVKKSFNSKSSMISNNGARVHDEENNEIIAHDLPIELSDELLGYNYGSAHTNVYIGADWYIEKEAAWITKYFKDSKYTIQPLKELKGKSLTKFFFVHEDPEIIHNLEIELEKKFGDRATIIQSLPTCLEVLPKGISKATALVEILKKEGITLEETIAFGDGLNDYEMLECVGKGFIMGNGSPRLIASLPNLEIIEENTADGVAKKLEEIFR